MTRDRIAYLLEKLVLELGNATPSPDDGTAKPPRLEPGLIHYVVDPIAAHEWAYVKGLASGAILRLRAQLLEGGES
jgi:hypothetical protein